MPSPAPAGEFPDRPVRIVVPAPPGGGTDIIARHIGERIAKTLGQPVVIDNRPGASGNLGADLVAKAKADGYTLLMGHNGILSIAPWLFERLPFDPSEDLIPVAAIRRSPVVIVVRASLGVTSLPELVRLAQSKPGNLKYGSAGAGSPQHIAGETFKALAHTDLVHVPYKGTAPVIAALLSDEIDVGFESPTIVQPPVQSGRLRALAIAGPRRLSNMPEVPTASFAGLPGFELDVWVGLFAPKRTPAAVIDTLHRHAAAAVRERSFRQMASSQGAEPLEMTPREFAAFIQADRARWGERVKASGARIE